MFSSNRNVPFPEIIISPAELDNSNLWHPLDALYTMNLGGFPQGTMGERVGNAPFVYFNPNGRMTGFVIATRWQYMPGKDNDQDIYLAVWKHDPLNASAFEDGSAPMHKVPLREGSQAHRHEYVQARCVLMRYAVLEVDVEQNQATLVDWYGYRQNPQTLYSVLNPQVKIVPAPLFPGLMQASNVLKVETRLTPIVPVEYAPDNKTVVRYTTGSSGAIGPSRFPVARNQPSYFKMTLVSLRPDDPQNAQDSQESDESSGSTDLNKPAAAASQMTGASSSFDG